MTKAPARTDRPAMLFLRPIAGAAGAGLVAALALAAWGAGRIMIAQAAYRIDPGLAADLFVTALLWYFPLTSCGCLAWFAAAPLARAAARRGPPGAASAGGEGVAAGAGVAAAGALFGLGLLVRAPGPGERSDLPGAATLLVILAVSAAAGHGASCLARAASRSPEVARRLRAAVVLSAGSGLALILWSFLREHVGVPARSAAGAAMGAGSLAGGIGTAWGAARLLLAGARGWKRLTAAAATIAAAAALWGFLEAGSAAPAAMVAGRERPLNVLLLVADTLRADRVGAYGSTRATTPSLDALARKGAVFTRAAALASWTLPTTATIMTGLDPPTHGLRTYKDTLREEAVGLAQIFRRAGYATGGIVANPILTREIGLARGFEHYDEGLPRDAVSEHPRSTLAATLSALGLRQPRDVFPRAGEVVERGLDWLRGVEGRPFFLYLHFMDPHDPYAPPPPWDSRYGRKPGEDLDLSFGDMPRIAAGTLEVAPSDFSSILALYDGAVSYMDEQVGSLLEALGAMGRLEDTLVVFVSDHGEEFLEHGGLLHEHTLYEELTRIPMIVAGPDVAAGAVLDAAVSQADIAPTLVEAAGLTSPIEMQGISLWGALSRSEDLPARDVFMEEIYIGLRSPVHAMRAVRRGSLKLIGSAFDPGGESPWSWELFDLESDPDESRNLIHERRGESAELRGLVEDWARKAGAAPPPRETAEEELQRLKSLGYVE